MKDTKQTNKAPLKIGLFGLSANPPHYGHIKMAQYAKAKLGLDEVWWIVAAQNPLKSTDGMAPFQDRYKMCQLIARDYDWLKVNDIEQRYRISRTFDTLKLISTENPDSKFIWIMGADNLTNFHQWYKWDKIIEMLPIAVMARPGETEKALHAPATLHPSFVAFKNPAALFKTGKGLMVLDNPLVPISSSALRQAARERNNALINETTSPVISHIQKKGLYF